MKIPSQYNLAFVASVLDLLLLRAITIDERGEQKDIEDFMDT